MTKKLSDALDRTPGSIGSSVDTIDVEFLNHAAYGNRHVLGVEVADESTYRRLQAAAGKGQRVIATVGDARLRLLVARLLVKPLIGVGDRVHYTVVLEGTEW